MTADINAHGLLRHTTMKVRIVGLRTFKARIWLGTKLFVLGAWVLGCGVNVETES